MLTDSDLPSLYYPNPSSRPIQADVAQLVEQLICNQQVRGSIPLVSSVGRTAQPRRSRGCLFGRLSGETNWLKRCTGRCLVLAWRLLTPPGVVAYAYRSFLRSGHRYPCSAGRPPSRQLKQRTCL